MRPYLTSADNTLSRKNRVIFLRIYLVFVVVFLPFLLASSPEVINPKLEVDRLLRLSGQGLVLIDTRSSFDFFLGHIPGAVNLNDWKEFTQTRDGVPGLLIEDPEFITNKLRSLGIDYDKKLVIYGDAQELWRTDGRFFWMFQYFGFKKVFLLEGGFKYWVKKGGLVERGKEKTVSPSSLLPKNLKFNLAVAADHEWISKRLGSSSMVLVDNRNLKEYKGATPYGSKRGGHIPGAIHVDWQEFFTDKGFLKDRKVLKNLLKRFGIRRDQDIVVYCTGGVRSGMAYFVFKYLGFKARNYDGSWWDWSNNPSLPAEL